MAKGVVAASLVATGRPHFPVMAVSASSSAPQLGRTSCGTNPLPVVSVLALQLRMSFAANSPRRRALSKFGWSTFSNSELRNTAVCSAAYGSSNGHSRPASGVQNPGDGYNSGFLEEDPELSKRRSPYSQEDRKIDKTSETSARRRGKISGLRSGDVLQRSLKERQGDDPYRVLENGQKVYLDELDVITLLEPPPFLRPLQSVHYNHAAFLWKKIGDIPEERRHRLLDLLLPRQITKMWELSKLRYEDPDAFVESAADMLPQPDLSDRRKPMVWDGKVIQGQRHEILMLQHPAMTLLIVVFVPWYLKLFSRFQKVFFVGDDNKVYGRVITGGKFLRQLSDRVAPLYFEVLHADSVMATEEPCDIMLEYGDGLLPPHNSVPPGFAKPVKHLPPFNDKACDYLRAVGPGVLVGQTWVEGRKLEQFPRQLYGEFMMVQKF